MFDASAALGVFSTYGMHTKLVEYQGITERYGLNSWIIAFFFSRNIFRKNPPFAYKESLSNDLGCKIRVQFVLIRVPLASCVFFIEHGLARIGHGFVQCIRWV